MRRSFLNILSLALLLLYSNSVMAQYPKDDPADDVKRTTNFPQLKTLVMTPIAGAPILSQPQRIDGDKLEIRTGKHGLCYPAVYDWNHDGLSDLILGEFSTGKIENNLKIYLNKGTKKKPKFTGEYFYGKDTRDSIITNYQWCCIGIHPRFVDITGDGKLDIISGQYFPGAISLWRGTGDGFLPHEYIPQEAYSDGWFQGPDTSKPDNHSYWNYTSANFADYDGDGLVDLFVGGCGGLRVALNDGTKENPHFGLRKYLYSVDGNVLSINPDKPQQEGGAPSNIKTYMTPVDWDGDKVLDILLTYEYNTPGDYAVLFFKGVQTNLGIRFKHPVPLFTTKDGSKALPGCQPMITVADLNNDGVNDLLLGLSIPTINGFDVADEVAWRWITDMRIEMPGKDAGEYYMFTTMDALKEKIRNNPAEKSFYLGNLDDEKYLTLRHRGYVFVMYGKKNPQPAVVEAPLTLEAPKPVTTRVFSDGSNDEPLTYQVVSKLWNDYEWTVDVTLSFKEGWHGYIESKATDDQGMMPTSVTLELPEKLQLVNSIKPNNGGGDIFYKGQIVFSTHVREQMEGTEFLERQKRPSATYPIKIHINYQSCNDKMCLPPIEHVVEYELKR